jgi:hypothetical protein
MHNRGVSEIAAAVSTAATSEQLKSLSSRIDELAQKSWISGNEFQDLLLKCWNDTAEKGLDKGLLTSESESHLTELASALSLSKDALVKTGAFPRIVKAAVIRDLLNGIVSERFTVTGSLPFALQNDEKVVWAFPDTEYIQDRVRRRHVGGQSIEDTVHSPIDRGWFVVTNKNLYFAGAVKSLRLPLKKIVSFKNFSNGLGLTREGVNARPLTFITGDGQFTYSLVSNLVKIVGTPRSRRANSGTPTINVDPVEA